MKLPDPNSKRSQRRKNRGFKSLELSSRKHRRAKYRTIQISTIGGKLLKPGEKTNGANGFLYTAGGSIKYN